MKKIISSAVLCMLIFPSAGSASPAAQTKISLPPSEHILSDLSQATIRTAYNTSTASQRSATTQGPADRRNKDNISNHPREFAREFAFSVPASERVQIAFNAKKFIADTAIHVSPMSERESPKEQNPSPETDRPRPVEDEPAGNAPIGYDPRTSSPPDKEVAPYKARISGDVFGRRGGFFHPVLSLSAVQSDNIFATNSNPESDIITTLSPGIWVAAPRIKEQVMSLDTASLSPGGYNLSRESNKSSNRYQTYLFYGADIEKYAANSTENAEHHKVEGLFQYTLSKRASFDVIGQFLSSQDTRGVGVSTEVDKYFTNLLSTSFSYELSRRFSLTGSYSNYLVDYAEDRNSDKNRTDNTLAADLFFRFMPKTSAFAEYEIIAIDYDNVSTDNSSEQNMFGGLEWNFAAKSKGRFKLGYGVKNFDDSSQTAINNFLTQLTIEHHFSSRDILKLAAIRRTLENTLTSGNYTLSNSITGSFQHGFTRKLTGNVNFSYTIDRYDGQLTLDEQTGELQDTIWSISPAVQYPFREWLVGDLAYIYTKRDSSFSSLGYVNNSVFIRISLML